MVTIHYEKNIDQRAVAPLSSRIAESYCMGLKLTTDPIQFVNKKKSNKQEEAVADRNRNRNENKLIWYIMAVLYPTYGNVKKGLGSI
jgi:hypothetical protein